MSVSNEALVQLEVVSDFGADITVLDHSYIPVARGLSELSTSLPRGLYQIVVRLAEARQRSYVALEDTQRVERRDVHLPSFGTAAPVAENSARGASAAALSASPPTVRRGDGGRLLVFLSGLETEQRFDHTLRVVEILDRSGRVVADLAPVSDGRFAGVLAELSPGPYRLRHLTSPWGELEQTVAICAGWQTDVFLRAATPTNAGSEEPRLRSVCVEPSSTSVLMSRIGEPFDLANTELRLTELLRYGIRELGAADRSDTIRQLLRDKFQNPMLGLFGLVLLLSERNADLARAERIVANLAQLVPEHPDVAVYEAWFGVFGATAAPTIPRFHLPPMLIASWQQLVRLSLEGRHEDLIPRDSLAMYAGTHWLGADCWLAWQAFDAHVADADARPAKMGVTGSSELPRQTPAKSRGRASGRKMLKPVPQSRSDARVALEEIRTWWAGVLAEAPSDEAPMAFSALRRVQLVLTAYERALLELLTSKFEPAEGGRLRAVPATPDLANIARHLVLPVSAVEVVVVGLGDKVRGPRRQFPSLSGRRTRS